MKNEIVHLHDFGFGTETSVSLEEIQFAVGKYKAKGYKSFEIRIDFGYYQGEEHLSLYGKEE